MKTTIGEYIVGAYLKLCLGCDVVDYNVRPPSGGREGLAEFDVIGIQFSSGRAYLCEVATHLGGLKYGNNRATLQRIKEKLQRQQKYAEAHLSDFEDIHIMFWSPVVPRGYLTQELVKIEALELKINKNYSACVEKLREEAKKTTRDIGNPFFRAMQILEHLRD